MRIYVGRLIIPVALDIFLNLVSDDEADSFSNP